jgi:hypothetical protein
MGVACAPPYANIFLYGLEFAKLSSLSAVLYFRRYIDDVFAVVLADFVNDLKSLLSNLCEGISFTWTGMGSSVAMLDLFIFQGSRFFDEGRLDFKMYQKAFNAYQ